MTSAAAVAGSLRGLMWTMLDAVCAIDAADPRRAGVDELVAQLAQVAASEELHASLAPALRAAVERAGQILAAGGVQNPPTPVPGPAPTAAPTIPAVPPMPTDLPAKHVDDVTLEGIDHVFADAMREARAALEQNPGRRLNVRWWLE